MNKISVLLSAIVAVVLLAGSSFAGDYKSSSSEMEESGAYTVEQLRGLTVVNQQGEKLGSISDVDLNSESGRVNFVILSKGGFMGVGEERHAVPLEALKIRSDEGKATLLVAEDKLETAPSGAGSMSDDEFRAYIQGHYGVAPAWEKQEGEAGGMMEKEEEYREKSRY